MTWRNSIIEVRSTRCDRKVNIGTGFFVSRMLALTSRHVLALDASSPALISVRLHLSPQDQGPSLAASIAWEDEKLDTALIKVNSNCAKAIINLSLEPPRSGARCATRGFPEGGKLDLERAPISFFGTTHSLVQGDDFFQVDVESDPTDILQWGGLSGAPVVIERPNDDAHVVGVVRSARHAMGKARHLEAIPARDICKSEGYCATIAAHESSLIKTAKKSRMIAALASGKTARRLKEESGHEIWYTYELDTLLKSGLIDPLTGNLTNLSRIVIQVLEKSDKFDYLF